MVLLESCLRQESIEIALQEAGCTRESFANLERLREILSSYLQQT
jgi:hypothetical protein